MATDEFRDIRHPEIDVKEALDVYSRLFTELGSSMAHLSNLQTHLAQGNDSLPVFAHQAHRSVGVAKNYINELDCLVSAAMRKLDESCKGGDACWCHGSVHDDAPRKINGHRRDI